MLYYIIYIYIPVIRDLVCLRIFRLAYSVSAAVGTCVHNYTHGRSFLGKRSFHINKCYIICEARRTVWAESSVLTFPRFACSGPNRPKRHPCVLTKEAKNVVCVCARVCACVRVCVYIYLYIYIYIYTHQQRF